MLEKNIQKNEFREEYIEKSSSLEDAVKVVQSGDRVFIGICSSMAYQLCEALMARKDELTDVEVQCSMYVRPASFFSREGEGHFCSSTFFMGPAERTGHQVGMTDFTSFHLSEVNLWCTEIAKPDVAFIEVSPPDEDGYMSFGASGVVLGRCVRETAKTVILQVNPNAPYVYGMDTLIHVSEADIIVEAEDELATLEDIEADETVKQVSEYILEQIPDGATIQLGLGGLSGAVGYGLKDRNDLGIHTELMTDSLMFLMKNGNVNNQKKTFLPGKSVTSFSFGSKELYQFLDHNEDIYFAPFPFVNDPQNIAKNDNMISVNTAMAIDLFGQVAADSLGFRQQSATGGQVDFVRGAQRSKGGKSFIAITSCYSDKKGEKHSRITLTLPPGTAVTTTRADVQYVVTEYGAVNLKTLTMRNRVKAMISLADPEFRPQLTEEAKEHGLL